MKTPSRSFRGPSQLMHFVWRLITNPGGASTRTSLYFAPQLGQSNRAVEVLDIPATVEEEAPPYARKLQRG